jgi:hypothetical protein
MPFLILWVPAVNERCRFWCRLQRVRFFPPKSFFETRAPGHL